MNERKIKKIRNRRNGRTRKIAGWLCIICGFEYIIPLIFGIWLIRDSKKKVALWDKYEAVINPRGNTSLAYISQSVGKSLNEVISDLKVMISKEFFIGIDGNIQAVIDTKENMLRMFINGKPMEEISKKHVEDSCWRYEEVVEGKGKRGEETESGEGREKERKKEFSSMTLSEKMSELKEKNEDEDIKLVLLRLEGSVSRIERRAEEKPEIRKLEDIDMLYSTYLPKTLELIAKLQKKDTSPQVAEKIKETLTLCADAFENIERKLAESDEIEILGDAAVLKSMLMQHGLENPDFKIREA